jgi:hypothetical protein
MLRIIRIAVALIAFFVITDFVAASNGGDVEGSGQGSDTAGISELGNSLGGHEDSGHDSGPALSGNPGSRGYFGFSGMYRYEIIKKRS